MSEFKLPDVGEGLTEAEIVAWKVKVGDVVAINDIIVEIETAKSLVELPSPFAGTVLDLMVPEGETVAVGTPIISIGDASAAPAAGRRPPTDADPGRDGDRPVQPARLRRRRGREPGRPQQAERGAVRRARRGAGHRGRGRRRDARPRCRRRVRSSPVPSPDFEGADEPAVPATSAVPAGGRIRRPRWSPTRRPRRPRRGRWPSRRCASWPRTSASTSARSRRPARTAPSPGPTWRRTPPARARRHTPGRPRRPASYDVPAGRRETREPIKGVRKMMAQAMVGSAFTAPHVTEWITVDVTRTMEFVDRLKARREFRDVKVSPLLVLSRAVMLAMRRTPEINSFWDEAAQEVVHKHYVNLGIAAATPRGLVVPNVKDAQDLSLLELAGALNQLTATAREGKTQPAEMSGGTFTITNVGVFGVDAGTPIINPGESAILCFGAVRKQPWVVTAERRGRAGDPPDHHAGALLRPPAHRRREGLALPRRRRRHPRGPGLRPAVLTLPFEGDPSLVGRLSTPTRRQLTTGRCRSGVNSDGSAGGSALCGAWRTASWRRRPPCRARRARSG